jgi:hypothetical protein
MKKALIRLRAIVIKHLLGLKILMTYKGQIDENTKNIFIEIDDNPWDRHLYTLIKFFKLQGFNIWVKPKVYFLGQLMYYPYPRLCIEEKLIIINFRRRQDFDIHLSTSNLTTHYYEPFFSKTEFNLYLIPIAMHPFMYHHDIWNEHFEERNRLSNVFFAGNFFEKSYMQLRKQDVFNILDRIKIHEILAENNLTASPKSRDEFDSIKTTIKGKLLVVQKNNFSIPVDELRKTLHSFHFIFAFPGVSMPICHNLIEAMSVGTIPIIQAEYARMFDEPLKHLENAIIFEGENDLINVFSNALSLEISQLNIMHFKVYEYYNKNFAPEAVVNKIVNNQGMNYFLADKISVRHLIEMKNTI